MAGQAGHGAEDESLAAVAVRADEVNDASLVSCALATDDLERCPGCVGELGVQVAGHAVLTSSRAIAAPTARKNARYATSLVTAACTDSGYPEPLGPPRPAGRRTGGMSTSAALVRL